ncbi:MAG TPA: aminotransferase class V-fold PLP-dependent enzyme [Gammaproteobacteria bacterium]|nr:aminotransferase class V-fold PLP-dependent enzyme [Gammaproteobacteria bacterium]
MENRIVNHQQKPSLSFSSTQYHTAEEGFLQACPDYEATAVLDRLREDEYQRLDQQRQVYLDYTGGGLYAQSQLKVHMQVLQEQVLGNPHSANPASQATTRLVEATRAFVLDYFHADPAEYFVVFTANASAALKLVGESYPFAPGGQYLLTYDNHNSVNGIREFARGRGADYQYVPLTTPELRIDQTALQKLLASADHKRANLFAFPAQSNFSGVKHPLILVTMAQQAGWDVLLDAAAFVPTNALDLQACKADFVCMSFYKMFGYPTGLGALLCRRQAAQKLRRPWFAGGTVNFATAQGRGHYLASGEAAFEDGTVNYLNIPAIKTGLEYLQQIGMETITTRVRCLTDWLLRQLYALCHDNGSPLVRLYGPLGMAQRGGTITFNLYDPQGRLLDYRRIEELAGEQGISLRTGCFCNPGAGELAEGLTAEDMRDGLKNSRDMTLPLFLQIIQHRGNRSAGAIRISVGLASNFADIYRFMGFIDTFRNQTSLNIGEVTFDIASCRVIRDGS